MAVDECMEFPTDGIWCIPVRSPRRAAGACARRLLLVARLGNYAPSGAVSVVWLDRACSSCRCPSRLRAARFPLEPRPSPARVVTRASRWPSLAVRRFRRSEEEALSITSVFCGTAPGFAKVGRDSADWPGCARSWGIASFGGRVPHKSTFNLGQPSQSANRSDESLNGVGHGRQREGQYASS